MFPMKKTVAALAAAALLAAPSPAFAQDTAISQLSSTSSKGSSKPNYYPDYDKDVTAPEKRPLEGSYTGSAPISLAIALAAIRVGRRPADDVRTWVRERLADHSVPRDVRFVDTLPRNAVGKVVPRFLPGLGQKN